MNENKLFNVTACRWKHFNRKGYSVFCSLNREVTIGVLTTMTLVFANVYCVSAQNTIPKQMQTYELSEVEVTGTRVPLTDWKSAKMVTVLSRADIEHAAVHSINDLLKYAVGVDVRQRGGYGIQTDISVCGGTFDQITILLNGINVSDPQTGHLAADFPVSMDDVERVEILEGPSARVYGTSAFTGAINIVTKCDAESNIKIRLSGGSYGLFDTSAGVNYTKGSLSQQISGSYNRCDGATENSDFNTRRGFYQAKYTSSGADAQWQLGYSNQKYGANTFYSAAYPNQYEETRRTLFSVRAETKGWLHVNPSIYWNRAYDHFQLIRSTSTGENYHCTDIYGMNINAYFSWICGKTSFGAELRNEGILSTSLGKPMAESEYVNIPGGHGLKYTKRDNRTNMDYFVEHNILLSNLTVSIGLLINKNTALDDRMRYYPGVDISYHLSESWKLFASWNKALRMPTFTDLYYKSPTLEGNVGLKPEKTQATKIGVNYRREWINMSINAYYSRGVDMIDWVKYSAEDVYHSANFKLDNIGVEENTVLLFHPLFGESCPVDKLTFGYAYVYQRRFDKIDIYKSNYALEYLRHKLVFGLVHRIYKKLSCSWNFRFQKRMGGYELYDDQHLSTDIVKKYPSFCLVDLKLEYIHLRCTFYAEANNLLNRNYYDYGNISQPGIWLQCGIKYQMNL